ncbi:MAG TPA: lysylphosphatidylglycerol synthase transmembrane domain-containing protein [Spirochaetota bacterium]|nr:lysylphosphatidylglycerol synthase transmembrane domain-containing protein [Spirochaetota bacterium]HQJ71814.1 lysylphosphatidylglycerol synthase transmembrane domain-containing protein [Spirochaetota bacterium]HRS77740.1 lysylphosphatidylglycerol synthase transmembrane domain-containing protein [Spirochaetota bacterium]HRT75801.1 lysylphosphatidylglycerol synthase transmembrane domain-containing protein [Spirochaetota bacterium]
MIPALKFNHDDDRPKNTAGPADPRATEAGIMPAVGSAKQFVKRMLPWIVGAAILAYLVWRIEVTPLFTALTHADPTLYAPVLTAFILVNFLADTQNLNALLKYARSPIPFRDSMIIRGASYLLMIIDYTLGMGSIVYYLKKYKNVPLARGTGSMLFLNYTTHVSLLILSIAGSLMAAAAGTLTPVLSDIALVFTALLTLAVITIILMKMLPDRSFMKKIRHSEIMQIFIESPLSTYIVNTLYRCGFYFTFIMFFYVAVKAFNMDIPFFEMVAFVPVILLVISIPISAFGLGTSQAAMLLLFKHYGTPAQILAFSLTYSASIIIFRGIIGACYYGIITRRVSYKYKASLLRGEVS